MGRCTELLTLYFQQPCLTGGGSYAEIRRVKNYRTQRLSWSKGNVNLTDYWYTMADAFMTQDLSYTGQHIDLLCDDESLWWQEQIDAGRDWVCLCFMKWKKGCRECREKEEELQAYTERSRFFRTFGNADCIYAFSAESQEILLEEIERQKKDRPLFFSRYYLYGRCRQADAQRWEIKPYKTADGGGIEGHPLYEQGWSVNTIGRLRKAVWSSRKMKNKKMMAYYQALGQIVNVVAQYEQSPVYKDLFYMFYPPISMFLDQLDEAEKEISGDTGWKTSMELTVEKHIRMRKIEISISEFIDSMETLLHHMGHSCRDILSEGGRGGIPYDIPIHLCLMYLAYLHAFTAIINDGGYRFEYCLVPLAYSRPTTRFFDFGLPPEGRLIRVQISRHMMFMPRSLLIILGHEVSHYVSEAPRQRKLRARCCVDIANSVMALRLVPEDLLQSLQITRDEGELELLDKYLGAVRIRVHDYLQENVWKKWDMENKEADRYHFSNFLISLEKVCGEILNDEDMLLSWNLEFVDTKTVRALRESNSLYKHILYIQNVLDERRRLLWEDPELRHFLAVLAMNLREIYADLLSICVLGVEWKEYIEAYIISESYIPEEDLLAPALINRFAVVKYLLAEDKKEGWGDEKDVLPKMSVSSEQADAKGRDMEAFLNLTERQVKDYLATYCALDTHAGTGRREMQTAAEEDLSGETDLFYYRGIIQEEINYLRPCYGEIKKIIADGNQAEIKTQLDLVRKLYRHFLVKDPGKDSSYREFFEDYDTLVGLYKEKQQRNVRQEILENNKKKESK